MAKHTDPRILRGKFVEGKEEEKKRLDRREMLQASVGVVGFHKMEEHLASRRPRRL